MKELAEKNINIDIKEVMENLKFRDQYDSTREHSPLQKAPDAILIDTTDLTIEEEIHLLEKIVRKKLRDYTTLSQESS